MRGIGWLLLALLGCSVGMEQVEVDARSALGRGEYGQAMAYANQGLKLASGDRAAIWRFEQIVLEAMCRSGQGLAVMPELQRLTVDYPAQLNAKLYLSLGAIAKESGDTHAAIELWAAGDKRFPAESASFKDAIQALQSAGDLAPAELEKLKSLGYIQ
jgi:tetratricopeptide (TPR) repeat protein